MDEADRIFVALISGVSQTTGLDVLDVFWHTTGIPWRSKFYFVYFFLLIPFLVVEDYEFPKRTSDILSVPLTLKCVRIWCSV